MLAQTNRSYLGQIFTQNNHAFLGQNFGEMLVKTN